MTEYNSFDVHSMKNMCRACLKITEDALPMSPDEVKAYQSFAEKVTTSENMVVCSLCKWLLRKCMKFMLQVQRASVIFNEVTNMDAKSFLFLQLSNFDMVTTHPEVHYLGCDEEEDVTSDKEGCDVGDVIDDDDEIPLVMLQDYKSKKRKEGEPSLDLEIKQEIIKEEDTQDERYSKRSRKKKEIKEGFTSRMVQETNEYTVIKLTVEQVLQELSEKAKTESYLRAPYKCEKCVKGYNFEDVLYTHMERHRQEHGSYKCIICSQYCPSQVSLRGHMKSHTTSKRTVIQRHVKSHATVEKHSCHTCGKVFNTIESLRVHTMRHDKTKRLQCPHCDKHFIYPSLLHKHIQAVHEREDYYCVECDVKFKSPESLRLHFKKAKRHRDSSSFKYECPHCQQRFVTTASLSVHLTTTHGEPKQHACEICNNRYSSKEALRAHVWRVHSHKRESPANCHLCEKSFSRKSILKVHVRTHTGERPHVCACGAAFTQRATLRAHHQAKHGQKEPNPQPALEVMQET